MELIGIVEFNSQLNESSWQKLLSDYENVVPADAIYVRNPFTEEVQTITSAKKLANVVDDGKVVGNLRWCLDDSGIEVAGDSVQMSAFGEELAKFFGSKFIAG